MINNLDFLRYKDRGYFNTKAQAAAKVSLKKANSLSGLKSYINI